MHGYNKPNSIGHNYKKAGLVLLSAGLGLSVAAIAAERKFEQIVYPAVGVTVTSATGINARGDVVGQYRQGPVAHGFLLDRHGEFSSLDYPGAVATNAWGISSTGDIAGDFRISPTGPILGFVRSGGAWETIDCSLDLNAAHTFAFGVNAAGDVVGEYKLPGVPLGAPGRAFLFRDGGCADITPPFAGAGASVAVAWSISDAGEVAGYFEQGGTLHGWIRDRQRGYIPLDHPDSVFTNVRGINASGDVVGLYRDAANATRGFYRDSDGEYSTLELAGAAAQRALGLNARGDVVGDYSGGDCPAPRCAWVLRKP